VLNSLGFFIAQGIFRGLKSSAKIFDTSGVFLSLFASPLAGLQLFLQVTGTFFGKMQRL
jgi:hypothetical protein